MFFVSLAQQVTKARERRDQIVVLETDRHFWAMSAVLDLIFIFILLTRFLLAASFAWIIQFCLHFPLLKYSLCHSDVLFVQRFLKSIQYILI